MFCPQCGQQQVSEETRFCSKCGFQLGLIPELIDNGGILPELEELRTRKPPFFNKKNGVMLSIFWCIFFIFFAVVFDGILNFDFLGKLFIAKGIFGGILILLASLAFLPSSKPKNSEPPSKSFSPSPKGQTQGALPPQQSQPVSSYVPAAGSWRAPETAEFANPGSVTDSTTKLLEKEE